MRSARMFVLLAAIGHVSCGGTAKEFSYPERSPDDLPFGTRCLEWPLGGAHRRVSMGFHQQNYPYKKKVGEHDAIDLPAPAGTEIRASAFGLVVRVTPAVDKEHAATITIRFGGRWTYHVGHLSRVDVKKDQYVRRGDLLGLSGGGIGQPGSGPWTTGPHLHYRVQRDDVSVDPEPLMCP